MAQSGYTPILIYASGTASNVPLAANLTSSASGAELALNYADGKLYFKNSSGVVTLLAGAGGAGVVAGSNTQIQFNNSGVFGASANLTWDGSKVTASAYQTGGNLTFTGTGNRITGDFSNATVANNVIFQTSTANSGSYVRVMPNGTATVSGFQAYASSTDLANTSNFQIRIGLDNNQCILYSNRTGTGAYLPMVLNTSGSDKLTIAADTTGTYTFGGTAPRITGDFSNATIVNRVLFQTSTTNSQTAVGILPNGTANTSNLLIYSSSSDPANSSVMQMRVGGDGGLNGLAATITGTGSYLPLMFWAGGSERMRLDTSGNVGIGTSSPAGKLEVSGGRSWFTANSELYSIAFRYSSSTGVMYMGATNSVSTPSIQFSNSGGTALATIDYSGNVGIGTSSPVYRLSVVGANNTGIASFSGNNNGVIPGSDGDATLVIGGNYAAGSAEVDYFHNNSTYKGTIGGHRFLQRTGASTTRDLMWLTENQTTFYTAGTERMRINSSGQVGIGTSAPTGQLDVRTAAGVVAQSNLYTGSNAAVVKFNIGQVGAIDWDIGLNATAGNFYIGGLGGSMAEAYKIVRSGLSIDYQTWNTGGAERMRIDSSGNVGVGTSAPTGKLHIYNSTSGAPAILNINSVNGGGGTTGIYFRPYQSDTQAASNPAQATIYAIDNNFSADLTFNTKTAGAIGNALVERMRIDSSGNVGIGTSSPVGKLDVSSSGQNIVVSRSTGSYAAFQRLAPTGQQTYDFYTINGVEVARITGDPTYLGFSTGLGTERMRIDSSGNVGIGTGSPSSYGKFAVIGSGTTASTFSVVATDNAGTSNFTVRDDGLVTANKPAGLGYGTGSGGTVTQATSKSTSVTLNKPTGQITMNAAALLGNTAVVFRLNDSLISSVDTVIYAASGNGNYTITTHAIFAGAVDIRVTNATIGSLSEALVINFSILKGATS